MRIRVFIDSPETGAPSEAWAKVALGVCENAERWFSAMQKQVNKERWLEDLGVLESQVAAITGGG